MITDPLFLLVFGGTTFCIFGIVYFVISTYSSEEAVVKKRFSDLSGRMPAADYEKQALAILKEDKSWVDESVFSEFPPLLNLPTLFEQAGIKMDVGRWLVMVVVVSGFAGLAVWFFKPNIPLVIVASSLTVLLFYAQVLYQRRQRIKAFEAGFPQSLEIIGRSLRAGHPFTMGMQMVSTEMPAPVGPEFAQVFYEMQMGLPLDDSLRRLALRVPLIDVRFFVLSLLIHQQTGGDLAEVLDNLSRVVRDRFKVMGQVKALTAEGRLSGIVLSALPVIVFGLILSMNPSYVRVLIDTGLGRKMLYIAGFLQCVGMAMIYKIVRIKV
ncbi:MAG: type II secretion system F family protein [Candidatus Omnitrophica bacterium]|nr:type II secretion system F family protein [Candidatus Omnitrophota bacterium]